MPVLDQLKDALTQTPKFNDQSPGATALVKLLREALGTAELNFQNARISDIRNDTPDISGFEGSRSFQVDDQLALFPYNQAGRANFSVKTTFLESADALEMSMLIAPLKADWQLSESFPSLELSFFNRLKFLGTPLMVLSSVEYTGNEEESIMVGLNFTATLALDGVLAVALAFIKGQENGIKISGPIKLEKEAAALRLKGDLSSVLPVIPGLDQIVQFDDPAFYLLATPVDEKKSNCSVEIQGDIHLGNDKPVILPITIGVPTGIFGWSLRLRHLPNQPDLTLIDLIGLFVADQSAVSLPDAFGKLGKTSLAALSVSFDPGGKAPTLIDVAIAVPGPWEAVEGYFGIKDMLFALRIQHDTKETSWQAGIKGIVEIGIEVPLALQIVPGGTWAFTISPEEGDTKPSLSDLAKVIGGNDLIDHLPPGISGSKILELQYASIRFNPSDQPNKIKQIDLKIDIVKDMDILPGYLKIQDVRADISISNPLGGLQRAVSGEVSGDFLIADNQLLLTATLPDKIIRASMPDLDLTELIEKFLPDSAVVLDHIPKLHFKDILIELDAQNRSYSISGQTADVWPVISEHLELSNISLDLQHFGGEENYTDFELNGDVIIEGIPFFVSAVHQGKDAGWQFSGWLDGEPIPLTELLEKMLKIDKASVPAFVPDVNVEELSISYDTATKAFSFEEQTSVKWNKKVAGIPIKEFVFTVKIDSELEKKEDQKLLPAGGNNGVTAGDEPARTRIYKGFLEGDLVFENDLALILRYDFAPKNKSLKLSYDSYSCTVSKEGEKTIFKLQLGYLKLGDLLVYAVNKVAPELHFKLEAPWNILNDIDLHNLVLELEIENGKKTARIEYLVNKKFAFVEVGTIALIFPIGGDKKVDFQVSGSFAGISYPPAKPLKWDLLNEKPPAPANGASKFDLRYLALGQHIALKDAAKYKSIEQILAALEKSAKPAKPEDGTILSQLTALEYRADSNWFIGADLTVLDAVSLSMIFNDPELYGLVVSLKGPKVKIFDGLKFEILYKKINDEIGEYYAELKLPDAMRHLEFGAVSITLPIVAVAIYTNGNFLIDFGFPWRNDFSRSMGIQLFPFVGAGGFYFGVLNGATSDQAPRITNGTWEPVIVFGLGLKVGIGKEIDEGIFRASLSLVVQGVVEGVLAVFNPTNPALAHEHYFKMQGTISIIGQVEGAINFFIIKAQVSIKVYAEARIVIESHQPIHFGLDAGIEVVLVVEVLMINIHLSFKARISQNFTTGQASATPWQLAPAKEQPQPEAETRSLRAGRSAFPVSKKLVRERHSLDLHETVSADFGAAPAGFTSFTAQARGLADERELHWNNAATAPYPSKVDDLNLLFVPAYTVLNPADGAPQNKVALVAKLFIENGIDTKVEKPFDQLIKTLFAWTLKAYTPAALGDLNEVNSADKKISFDALDNLYKALCAEPLPGHDDLVKFLNASFKALNIQAGDALTEKINATVFPIPPTTILSAGTLTRNFAEYGLDCDTDYIKMIALYLEQLQTAEEGAINEPAINGKESFATLLFNDYFGLLIKAAVQGAQKLLQTYTYTIKPGAVSDQLKQYGISFDHVEGYTYSPGFQQFAFANKDILLAKGTSLALKEVHFPIKADTVNLQSIASLFITAPQQPGFIQQVVEENLFESSFLQSAATVVVVEWTYLLPDNRHSVIQNRFGVKLDEVRLANRVEDEMQVYAPNPDEVYGPGAHLEISNVVFTVGNAGQSTLNTLNKLAYAYGLRPGDLALANQEHYPSILDLDYDAVLPNGQQMLFPTIQYGVPPFEKESIALYFGVALEQLTLPDAANYKAGSPVKIKQITYKVLPGDSFASIGRFFLVGLDQLGNFIKDQNVLAAGRGIALPDFPYATQEKENPATISAQFGIDLETLVWYNLSPVFPVDTVITIPKATVPVADLMARLIHDEQYGAKNLAGMCSRFLLHGLRLPTPGQNLLEGNKVVNIAETKGLYELTGQQFDYEAPLDKISLKKADSSLKLALGNLGDALDFSLANFNGQDFPTLKTASAKLPNQVSPYAPFEKVVHKFTLQQSIPWQCAQEPAYIGTAESSGGKTNPVIWLFPDNLQSTLQTKQGLNLSLYKGSRDQRGEESMTSEKVGQYRWASFVSLKVKRIEQNTADNALTHSYQLVGAETESDRHLLTNILAANNPDMELQVLYAPNPTNDITGGLRSDLLYPKTDTNGFDKVKIIKTNLATLAPPKSGSKVLETSLFNVEKQKFSPAAIGNIMEPDGPFDQNGKNAWVIQVSGPEKGADWGAGNSLTDLWGKTPRMNTILRFNICADTDNQQIVVGLGKKAAYTFPAIKVGKNWQTVSLNLGDLPNLPDNFYELITIPFCCRGVQGGGDLNFYIEAGSMEYLAVKRTEVLSLFGQASINETQKFLQLAWEASIVNTEGYYFQYQNAHDQGLPQNLFSREPEAILRLLILGPIQTGGETKVPTLCNCVLIKDPINPNTQVLYAQDPSVEDWLPTMKPGYIGFDLSRPNPDASAFIPIHYNLLAYQIQANNNDLFERCIEALPLGPRKVNDTHDWHYAHVVPLSKLSKNAGQADKPGLPIGKDNPYNGLGESLQIKFIWQDIFGNQALDQSFSSQQTILYRDQLLPITQWPGTVSDFNFTGTPGNIQLNFYVHLDVSKYLPDLAKTPYSCLKRAEKDLLQYQNIYFQLHQEDVQFQLYTSLDGDQTHALAKESLTQYVDAAYLFTDLLAKSLNGTKNGLLASTCKVAAAVNHLKSIAATYHVSFDALADANKSLNAIFPTGAQINRPDYYTVLFNDSLTMIDAGRETSLATLNADREKVLTEGVNLKLTINQVASIYTVKSGDTLASVAAFLGITVEQLAGWNKDLPNLFQSGARLLKNQTKAVLPAFPQDTAVSLENIARHWEISVEELAFTNSETDLNQTELIIPGVFSFIPEDADNNHPFVYQVDTGESLPKIAAKKSCTATDLFYANIDLQGILATGSPLQIRDKQYSPDTRDTLRSVYHYFEQQFENLSKETFIQALADTVIFASSAYIFIPPAALALQTPVVPKYKKEVFALNARFEIKRTAHVDEDWAAKVPAIKSVQIPLTARMEASAQGSLSLIPFAEKLESALGNTIKVATRNASGAAKVEGGQNLWAIPIVEKTSGITDHPQAITYEIKGDKARFYAAAPLANKLLSRKKVAVRPYTSGIGLATEATVRTFSGVDIDQWGEQFLAAIDHYLTAPYAIPAADLAEAAYNKLIQAKRTLADAISTAITPILLEDASAATQQQLSSARAAMEQRLLENLSSAYTVDAIVQLDTTVYNSDYQQEEQAPRLFGKPMLTKDAAGTGLEAVSLSTASIPLDAEGALLTFLVEKSQQAGNPQQVSNPDNIALKFQYKVNGLEIGVGEVDAEGYQDYDWFSFVLPFNENSPVIETEVPVPLRHYPVPPALIAQQGVSHLPEGDAAIKIEDATRWTYEITYEQYEESQDEIELRFSFNGSDDVVAQSPQADGENEKDDADLLPEDLFSSLAAFNHIWPQLEEDLELLHVLNTTNDDEPNLEKAGTLAVQTFAELALNVANNWLQWNEVTNKAPQEDNADYICILKEYAGDDGYLKISIRSLNNHVPLNTIPGIQVPGQNEGYYVPSNNPELRLLNLKTGKVVNAIPQADDFQFVSAIYANFKQINQPLKFTDARNIHQRQVTIGDLSILRTQNAWAGIVVSRNRDLIEGKTTHPAFVYQTPWVRFPNHLTPSIRIDRNLYISEIDSPSQPVARSLAQHLSLLFSRLLDMHPEPSASQRAHQLKLTCKYGFALVSDPQKKKVITTSNPVLLQPEFTFEVDDWMISKEGAKRASFVTRLTRVIQEWQQTNCPNMEGGGYVFEITLLTGSEEAEKLLNFLANNHSSNLPNAMSRTRMPLSYYIEQDYWTTAPDNQDNPDVPKNEHSRLSYPAFVERMLATYGADIYDVATMQIALSMYPDFQAGTQLAQEWTQRLLSGRSGILDNTRGFVNDDMASQFEYGDNAVKFPTGKNNDREVPGPYFFRMIADQWAFIDPLTGESIVEIPNPNDDENQPPTIEAPLSWTDWKPITGENAWAAMIGPLQLEYSRSQNDLRFDSEGVQLALYILPALESMQAKNGGIYYAPKNTAGNQADDTADAKSISNENNFSTYAGVTMLMEVLAICYKKEQDPQQRIEIENAFARVQKIARGMLRYFQGKTELGNKYNLLNEETPGAKSIYTGGTYKYGPFAAGVDGFKDFAVDVHTWGCSVLGIQNVEKWFGNGSVYDLWQTVKKNAGYFEEGDLSGNILGVGYTNVGTDPFLSKLPADQKNRYIISAEWSFGAITMCRVVGQQYMQQAEKETDAAQKEKYYAYAAEMLQDAATMTSGVRSLLLDKSRSDQDIYAYYYANRRYFIPFGWFANRVASLCSTSWALMVMNNYNPFVLGGSYQKQVIDPNTFSLDNSLNISRLKASSVDFFAEFYQAGIPGNQHKLINFLIHANTKNLKNPDAQFQTGMPLSFFVNTADEQKNYWQLLYNDKDGVYKKYSEDKTTAIDAATERVLVHYGINIYDASTMQIALAIYPAFQPGMNAAKDQTLRLLRGFSIPSAKMPESRPTLGAPSSIRGWTVTERSEPDGNVAVPERERFYYGKDKKALFPNGSNENPGAFYFRSIAEQFSLKDPMKSNNEFSDEWPQGLKLDGNKKINWLDWKPITGENAWACLIGPLQYAFSEHAGMPPMEANEVQLALKVLPAYLAMQAENGGIFYAPWHTAANEAKTFADPFSISNENNFSSFAGLIMLQQILEANGDTAHLADVNKLLAGLEVYFEQEIYDKEGAAFFTGGTYGRKNDSVAPDAENYLYTDSFIKGGSSFPFAVDVHTWGCTVLGVERVDKWFGEGTAFDLWQTVKQKAGYFSNNLLQGVGYTDVAIDPNIPENAKNEYIISAEWSLGAVTMCLVLADQYEQVDSLFYNPNYAASLRADAQNMLEGVKNLLLDKESMDARTEAYFYANRRYYIPFGWYGNRIDSLCSTAWAIMCANRFNPFILGGDYSGHIISRNHGAAVKQKEHKPVLRLENVCLSLDKIREL